VVHLYEGGHFTASLDEARRFARCERTARAYASIDEVEAAHRALLEAVGRLPAREYALLLDLRLAPPRNDGPFEAVVGRYNRRLLERFRKVAFLVKTEVGRLHVTRLLPAGAGPDLRAFTDERAALDFLNAPGSVAPPAGGRPGGRP
jgi:hypothetical protein